MKENIKKFKTEPYAKFFSPAYNEAFSYSNGKFYTALCNAISYADKHNSEILQKAYPELYEMIAYFNYCSKTAVDSVIKEIEEEEKTIKKGQLK